MAEELSEQPAPVPRTSRVNEVFKLFAQHACSLVPGLKHLSVLLLPPAVPEVPLKNGHETATAEPPATSSAINGRAGDKHPARPAAGGKGKSSSQAPASKQQGVSHSNAPAAKAKHTCGKGACGSNASQKAGQQGQARGAASSPGRTRSPGKAEGHRHGQCSGSQEEIQFWQATADALEASCTDMDWSKCLMVNFSAEEGPTLVPAPTYPFFCSSAHHVIETAGQSADSLVVTDFTKNGPHFFDWEDLHEQGMVAMGAVPVKEGDSIVAVLTVASEQPGVLDRPGLMGMLALAIAPHINALRGLQPGTSLERFMARLVPELIEDRCCRIKAALGPLQKQNPKSDTLSANGKQGTKSATALTASAASLPNGHGAASATTLANGHSAQNGHHHHHHAQGSKEKGGTIVESGEEQGPAQLQLFDLVYSLVSTCLVCAYLVGPAVGAGGRNALAWSTCVALADVLLLAARWRCTDRDGSSSPSGISSADCSALGDHSSQESPHGTLWKKPKGFGGDELSSQRDWGFSTQLFSSYRQMAMPVANTWLSWSLLRLLHVEATLSAALFLLAAAILGLVLGVWGRMRFLLQGPLQLVSVLCAVTIMQLLWPTRVAGPSPSPATWLLVACALQLLTALAAPTFMKPLLGPPSGSVATMAAGAQARTRMTQCRAQSRASLLKSRGPAQLW
ncbi:hypothetical protein WJX74_000990 [Apatococcus lobatus]|uniref:GAF domain-containing protein n=1 Tax=Apatococcus lobatus TaxID=904363 RepID=A0AAW1REL7_9CHLO